MHFRLGHQPQCAELLSNSARHTLCCSHLPSRDGRPIHICAVLRPRLRWPQKPRIALGEQLAALQRLASHEVVLVRLSVPRPERTGGHTAMDEMNAALRSQAAGAAGGQLRAAMHRFQARCPELMDRSKRHKRECTNVC